MMQEVATSTESFMRNTNRQVSFSDDVQVISIEPRADEMREILYYSAEEINQMKNQALVEIESTFASAHGQDLFDVDIKERPSLCMRPSSLIKICSDRELSPMPRSSRIQNYDLGEGGGATLHPERAHLDDASGNDQLKNDVRKADEAPTSSKTEEQRGVPSSSRRERRTVERTRSGQSPERTGGRLRSTKRPQRSKTAHR
jgi:hypothetical protein